jgi:hypothetical protein
VLRGRDTREAAERYAHEREERAKASKKHRDRKASNDPHETISGE